MSVGMADIIAAHWAQEVPSKAGRTFALLCQAEGCGWGGDFFYTDHSAHVAEELAKAGYGNIQEALLSAADEMPIETLLGADKASVWLRARAHSVSTWKERHE